MSIFTNQTIWAEGKYFDLWTVNHFLAGVLLGYVVLFFEWNVINSLGISISLMIGWEVIERFPLFVEEAWQNGVVDVIAGALGFVLVFILSPYLSTSVEMIMFVVLFILWLNMGLFGFITYKNQKS